MRFPSLIAVVGLLVFSTFALALPFDGNASKPRVNATHTIEWDKHSLIIDGRRVMIYSGEFHPFRLPVSTLWQDVLEKIKAMGFNAVSFYINWALLEGKPGEFRSEGIFSIGKFCTVAADVGLYVVARPGPYINAEVSGGGFPGWLQRIKGHLRTTDADYLAATNNYASNVAQILSLYDINNGGPVILYQPENEYTIPADGFTVPDPQYMQDVEDQARTGGVRAPFMNNDAFAAGNNRPNTGAGSVDIYGYDSYPWGLDCSISDWPVGGLNTDMASLHANMSPETPLSLPEFQGGSYSSWGDAGFEKCAQLFNHEQVRVLYKNNYAAGVAVFNIYMIFGGTNWGNLGTTDGYTSYDYAAAIAEDRTVAREKYSELKLEANFLKVSPGYLETYPDPNVSVGVYSENTNLAVTRLFGINGGFYVVRNNDYSSKNTLSYNLRVSTSQGDYLVPTNGKSLALYGRDSKIYVTDYPIGFHTLIHCTAEIFTWKSYHDKTVVVLYGEVGESHELSLASPLDVASRVASPGVNIVTNRSDIAALVSWDTTLYRQYARIDNVEMLLVDRNSAYKFWTTEISNADLPDLIIKGPYLVREATIKDDLTADGWTTATATLYVRADFNETTDIEIIGVPQNVTSLAINKVSTPFKIDSDGHWLATVYYQPPSLNLPVDLTSLKWKYLDSLPEIQQQYDDSAWQTANLITNNTYVTAPNTSVSLYGSDYGFHAGVLIFRGHFAATGQESSFQVTVQGGDAMACSVWLDDVHQISWAGSSHMPSAGVIFSINTLEAGSKHVFTVLVDNMGLEENIAVGGDDMKTPRGIMQYNFYDSASGVIENEISWKITGNLGGEDYKDKGRGPLNEGGFFAERMGYHLPGAPHENFTDIATSPFIGVNVPGVQFWTTEVELDIPSDRWDVPLAFQFGGDQPPPKAEYRLLLFVNGFQFGRYIPHIGPQTLFPVPEGILNYKGNNTIALLLWTTGAGNGAKILGGLKLVVSSGVPILTGRYDVIPVMDGLVEGWKERDGAY
ncbi:glycoside hydrolase [Podospora fimiseda]|uniref:Beta-galactosidase n=1 Tax=Podospora fimiseda TaxID=252190 RepID=A0AAN7BU69_9PEZI|nr:glycoside hydrolase [Podospora fimiseda]